MPSYNVIAADMLRDLVTLTFHLLTLVSERTYMAGHVINPSTKFEDPTAIRSRVMGSDICFVNLSILLIFQGIADISVW